MFGSPCSAVLRPEEASALEKITKPKSSHTHKVVTGAQSTRGTSPKQSSGSEDSEYTFKLFVNVSQFDPKEVTIKCVDNFLVVQAKKELKPDHDGYDSREGRFEITEDVIISSLKSIFGRNGILFIKGLRKITESSSDTGVTIPMEVQKPDEEIPEEMKSPADVKELSPTATE